MDRDVVVRAREIARARLSALADPAKAPAMQAYLKTEMPFYGVQTPQRTPIVGELASACAPVDQGEYERVVLGLWQLEHREEKYLALGYAQRCGQFVAPLALPLYRRLVVEGAWWDLVDTVATQLVRRVVVADPGEAWPVVEAWVVDDDMWLRRAAILSQIGAKDRTDAGRLFDFCAARAGEREFFIRKAIGWALREYARTDPAAVADFAARNRQRLSPLSYREATRNLEGFDG